MTGNQINSFVGNLVEMAKAFEELPEVKRQAAELAEFLEMERDTVRDRELRIASLKAELAEAHALRQKVEAERDEAIGSFLAADDRADKILAFVKNMFGNAGALIQAVEPPPVAKPATEALPNPNEGMIKIGENTYFGPADPSPIHGDPLAEAPLHPAPQEGVSASGLLYPGQSVDPLQSANSPMIGEAVRHGTASEASDASSHSEASLAAPEVAPTPSPTPAPSAPTGIGTESDRSGSDPDASPAPTGPYVGRYYIDVPGWISLSDWLAGGGTEANYYFRR